MARKCLKNEVNLKNKLINYEQIVNSKIVKSDEAGVGSVSCKEQSNQGIITLITKRKCTKGKEIMNCHDKG